MHPLTFNHHRTHGAKFRQRLMLAILIGALGPAPLATADQPRGQSENQALTDRELYSRAASALLAKEISQAALHLSQLVDQHPESPLAPLAAMRLAECQLAESKWSQAAELLQKWLPELSQSTQARTLDPAALLKAHVLLGRAYLHSGRFTELEALCQSQCALYPDRSKLADAEAKALAQLESFVTQAKQKQDEGQATALREAAAKVKEKQFAQAQATLAQIDATRLSSGWLWRYHVLRSQCALGQNDPNTAVSILSKIALDKLSAQEQSALRMIRLEAAVAAGLLAEAQQELEALTQLAGNDERQAPTIALRSVELAMLRKDRLAAEQIAQAAKARYPSFESLHEFDLLLARNALARIEFDQARQILLALLQAPPARDPSAAPRAHWLLGESYLLSQSYAQAIAHYSAVIDSQQASTWMESALMQRGKCFEHSGDPASAIADYRLLVRQFPHSALRGAALERLQQLGSPEAVELNSTSSDTTPTKEASQPQATIR